MPKRAVNYRKRLQNRHNRHNRHNRYKPNKTDNTCVIADMYIKTNKLLGTGLHSYVYDGYMVPTDILQDPLLENTEQNSSKVLIAIKDMKTTAHELKFYNIIRQQLPAYKSLITIPGYQGVPLINILYSDERYIIMEQCKSLSMFKLDITQVLYISILLLDILSSYHSANILHRDVKPTNVLYKDGKIYLIDFSISCFSYERRSRSGTLVFMSLNTHAGKNSRKIDDLISYAYTIINLIRRLPWIDSAMNVMINLKQQYKLEQFARYFGCSNCTERHNNNTCPRIPIMNDFLHKLRHSNDNIDYQHLYDLLYNALKVHEPEPKLPCNFTLY